MVTPIVVLIFLVTPLLLACILGRKRSLIPDISKLAGWGLGACFLFFSLGHFVQTEGMIEMLPPWISSRSTIIYLTGILELLIGIALFTQAHRQRAARLAILILIAFFPANIYAAFHAIDLGGHQWGPVYLLIRAPLQLILIAWAYYLCIKTFPSGRLDSEHSHKNE